MRRRSMHDGARYARPVPKARRFAMGCDGAMCMMERAARAPTRERSVAEGAVADGRTSVAAVADRRYSVPARNR